MKTFFFEILSEEIPARMQIQARENLKSLLAQALTEQRLTFTTLETYTTPRRLVGVVRGLPEIQEAREEEIRGPRVDAPPQALEGFLKSQGLTSFEQCVQRQTPKGIFWFYVFHAAGKKTIDILGTLLTTLIHHFPWPKSMTWGDDLKLTWIRPIQGVLALFGEDIVPLSLGEKQWRVDSSRTTVGHRFLSPASFEVASFEDYVEKLKRHYVILKNDDRKRYVEKASQDLAHRHHLEMNLDEGLLEEITGLVEWPVPLLGTIDKNALALPDDVLKVCMRHHQRYFSLTKRGASSVAPYFIVVSNGFLEDDAAKMIVEGNETVLKARFSDALFFLHQDQATSLDMMMEKLKTRIFYTNLGTLYDKGMRLKALCEGKFGCLVLKNFENQEKYISFLGRAGFLAKADLASAMIGEFPELQGRMGCFYAHVQDENPNVSLALLEHYAPSGGDSKTPTHPVSVVLALADRLDTLVGFFALGLCPTGSKDPFALRRSALGVLKLLKENHLKVSLNELIHGVVQAYQHQNLSSGFKNLQDLYDQMKVFFEERLKAVLKQSNIPVGCVEAALKKGWENNVSETCELAESLNKFLKTQNGEELLAVYRRSSHILKDLSDPTQKEITCSLFEKPCEADLFEYFQETKQKIEETLQCEKIDFKRAFTLLLGLKNPLDIFFEEVQINVEQKDLRHNRIGLLQGIVALCDSLADFSKIEKEG